MWDRAVGMSSRSSETWSDQSAQLCQGLRYPHHDSQPPGLVTPRGLNASGAITGTACGLVCHGYLQTSNDTVTTFDPPGSTFTVPVSINPGGEIAGDYSDANNVSHGFVFADHDRD